MFNFLALITNKKYWVLHSWGIKIILRLYGIKVGKRFRIHGVPKLKINGRASDIVIGNDVTIGGDVDFRNRENGKILIKDGAYIDNDCRFVAANDAVLTIGERTRIGCFSLFNCGVDVTLGKDCLLAAGVHVQSSEHGTAKDRAIYNQDHLYGRVEIGDDVWIASGAMIAMDVILGEGCVVGAKSFVRKTAFEPYTVVAGVPAKAVRKRI